jgi:cytochrome c peroxidase
LGYLESENVDSVGAFKTPTLRQLKDSAPYGHDGRFSKLEEVLQHYNELKSSAAVGREEATLRPLGLTRGELKDLEAFLLSLQGKVTHLKR